MLSGRGGAKVGQVLISKGRWKTKVRGESRLTEAGAEGEPKGGIAKA